MLAVRSSQVSVNLSTPNSAGATKPCIHPHFWDRSWGFGPGPSATSLSRPASGSPGCPVTLTPALLPPSGSLI